MDSAFRELERENVLISANAKERIRRLIIRMNYIRQGSLQFSGAQVAAMILNVGREGTHYTNASFTCINLYRFINYVQNEGSDFRVALTTQDMDGVGVEDPEGESEGATTRDIEEEVIVDEAPPIQVLPSMIEDFIFRGEELNGYNLYEMYRDTESVGTSVQEMERYNRSLEKDGTHVGRPYNRRVYFQAQHSKHSLRWTIIRSKQMVPCILGTTSIPTHTVQMSILYIGPAFPHSEDDAKTEQRAMLLLLLFKPWRCPQDLKGLHETWLSALIEFQLHCSINSIRDFS
jgi:hypothetical protein